MAGKVYILGAGASHFDTLSQKYPLPLANQFLDKKYIEKYWSTPDLYLPKTKNSALSKILEQYYGVSLEKCLKRNHTDINIEEVFSFIEHAITVFPGQFHQRKLLSEARSELLHYIENVIRYSSWKDDNLTLYPHIINSLSEGDTIISFNWDLLAERQIKKNGDPTGLLKQQATMLDPYREINENHTNIEDISYNRLHAGYLIKIHGSLNIVQCTDSNCVHSEMPYRFSLNAESLEMWQCMACGSPLEVMILPPHNHKSYKTNRFIKLQANIAAQKLSLAQEIIIIGYSFPIFDYQASMLLRMARLEPWETNEGNETWLNKVTIIDKQISNKSFIKRIKNLLGAGASEKLYGHDIELEALDDIDSFLSGKKGIYL